jgi:hypothetical protein
MRTGLRQSVWIGCGLLALSLSLWSHFAPLASAAAVTVSQVRVTVCGDGVTEGAEQCDPGKHCANGLVCTADADCSGIGDGLCKVLASGGCSASCTIVSGGSRPPSTQVSINEITVRPEQRYSGNGNNYDVDFYFSLLNSDNLNHYVIYQHSPLLSSNPLGVSLPYVTLPDNVTPGVYDAWIKPKSHLAKLLNNVYLQAGDNNLNFTNYDNGATIGSVTLLAGDIDGNGNSSNSFGDNVINAVDISVLLSQMGSNDPSGNLIRANLNQDTVVDQSDLNILLGNLDKEGDR